VKQIPQFRGVIQEHIYSEYDGATSSINSSALEVACPPPGIGAKKVQESSDTNFGITYIIAGKCLILHCHFSSVGRAATRGFEPGPAGRYRISDQALARRLYKRSHA
jgi:hypothetical protein